MESIREFDHFALYLNQHVQSHHVFDYMLDRAGTAERVVISSFAITEAYIRHIVRQRERIAVAELILDFTIGTRNPRILMFAGKNCDAVYLVNNHSKFIYLEKGTDRQLAIMSNNATNNRRYESGIILWEAFRIEPFRQQIDEMIQSSVRYG